MVRRGRRTWVRETVACPSCGARQGASCVAYRKVTGKTTGKPTGDVHAARWRAFREHLKEQARARSAQS
jgi:hypothetical protein